MSRTSAATQPKTLFAITTLVWGSILVAVLAGCATLSEGECKTADWFQIGQQDGRDGHQRSRLYDHRKACTEYGIRPDSKAYYAGRKAGLAHYCTARNGFDEGRAGNAYGNVCPATSEPDFLAEYRKGEAIHDVDEDIEDVERDIDRKENQLDDDISDEQADELRGSLRRDYDKLRYLNRELIRLERRYHASDAVSY